MKQAFVWLIGWIWLAAITGCAGSGEVIPIHLCATPASAEKAAAPPLPLRVAIGAFEDGRGYQTSLGVRTHLWGGVSYFDVPGSKPADAVSQTLTEYLKAKGWQVVKPGNSEGADVAIAGKLQEFIVHAKSRLGSTEITAKTKLALQATNSADGSVVRMVLNGSGSEDVIWFDPKDMQGLVNDVLSDSFGKLLKDTTVVDRMLRLKHP